MPGEKHAEAELRWLRRRHEELLLLYETIHDLSSTLSTREVIDRLLERVLTHLDAEIGSVLLTGADEVLRIVAARGLPPDVVDSTGVAFGEGISGSVVASAEPLLVTDIEHDPRFARRNRERYYTASLISAPLMRHGRACGVINVNNKRSREPFVEDDLRLLEALAGHATFALANADEYERMLERARRDSLTGLANHGSLWATLEVEHQRASRYGHTLGLVMIDIDHFKPFNDRFGHLAGDEALCAVARILEANSRSHDLVARYGGEEFAVILPQTGLPGAALFAEKVRQAIAGGVFVDDAERALTVSLGVAEARAGSLSPRELVERADARLYAAKSAGRDRVVHGDD